MFDFNPFDMDFDGDVDGIDLLGFDYLMRHVLRPDEYEDDHEGEEGYDGWDDGEDEECAAWEDEVDDEEYDTWDDDHTPWLDWKPDITEEDNFGPGERYDV